MNKIIGGNLAPASAQGQPQVRSVVVDEESAGQRLDNFLIRHLKGVPKTHVYRIIRSGEVRVNKGRAGADTRVVAGDVVRVPPVRTSEKAAQKVEMPAPGREFPLLMEDESLLAIDKPAGVAVHGGSGVSFAHSSNAPRCRFRSTSLRVPGSRRPRIGRGTTRRHAGARSSVARRSTSAHCCDTHRGKRMLSRIVAMLTRMCR